MSDHQRQPALRAGITSDNYHTKWFFNGFHVKFFRDMAWFMADWATLGDISALRVNSLEETRSKFMNTQKQGLGLALISSVKNDIVLKEVLYGCGINRRPLALFCPADILYCVEMKSDSHSCAFLRPL